jgi:hypothetical protein
MTDNSRHQPPADYIWPEGFYPIYPEHGLNLLAAEKYIESQKRRARWEAWNREHPWNWRTQWRTHLISAALLLGVSLIVTLFGLVF